MPELLGWVLERLVIVAAVFAVLAVIAAALALWRRRRVGWADALRSALLDVAPLATLGPVVALAFAPGSRGADAQTGINLIPFRDIFGAALGDRSAAPAVADIVANVAVFVPIGAVVAARFPRLRLLQLAIATAAVSIAIEVGQALLDFGRASDATDVVTNVSGALLGYVVWRDVRPREDPGPRDASHGS